MGTKYFRGADLIPASPRQWLCVLVMIRVLPRHPRFGENSRHWGINAGGLGAVPQLGRGAGGLEGKPPPPEADSFMLHKSLIQVLYFHDTQ